MNPLFDAIEEYVGVRLELSVDRPRHTQELRSLLAHAVQAEANLRKVCAGVCRVDGEGLPGSTPPDNDGRPFVPGEWVYQDEHRALVLPDRPDDPPHDGFTPVWYPHLQRGKLAPTSLLRHTKG